MGIAGWAFLGFFGLAIPYMAVKAAQRIGSGPLPPKKRYFSSVIVQLAVFGVAAVAAGIAEGIELFPRAWPPALAWWAALAALAGLVGFMRPRWRKRVEERARKVWLFMPRDGTERALWLGSSFAAGIAEELVYRGVLFMLLWRLTKEPVSAALLSAGIFGISHYVQGRTAMLIIFAMGLLFQGLAWFSGSLYVPMALHAAYDVCAGLHYGWYGRQLGYPLEAPPPEVPA